MQLCMLIYCSLTAVHILNDIFAHHQEHLNCIYSFWYYSRMWLPAGVMDELERQLAGVMDELESQFQLIHDTSRQSHT